MDPGPSSTGIVFGLPRHSMIRSRLRITRLASGEKSTLIPKPSQLKSSATTRRTPGHRRDDPPHQRLDYAGSTASAPPETPISPCLRRSNRLPSWATPFSIAADGRHRAGYVCGSGTTLIAADLAGRQARLIEYDPIYCDSIIARWQALTGKVAVHCETSTSREDLLIRRSAAGAPGRFKAAHSASR